MTQVLQLLCRLASLPKSQKLILLAFMKTLLIDSSYLLYRSYFSYPNLMYNGKYIGAFFGFAKTILQLLQTYKPDQLIFAGDTKEPTWRHHNYPSYKAGRSKIEDNMVSQIPMIQAWTSKITVNDFKRVGWEADDIIFTIAVQELTNYKSINFKPKQTVINKPKSNNLLKEQDSIFGDQIPVFGHKWVDLMDEANKTANSIFIFSSDKDLYQMLHLTNLQIITPTKLGLDLFNEDNFKQKYQLDPIQWLDYKALVGDGSDNLKGVDGVGPKTATSFLQEVGSLYNFYKALDLPAESFLRTASGTWNKQNTLIEFLKNPKNTGLIQKLVDNYEVVKITYILSSLEIVPSLEFLPKGYQLNNGLSLLEECGFKSLVTMQNRLQPIREEGLF
jgi:5'-3' exonuclease